MKKINSYFILFFLLINLDVTGQSAIYLSEDFSGNFPPDGWSIGDLSAPWYYSITNNAGGTEPEAKLRWVSSATGNISTKLISPPVDLTGLNEVTFSFKYMLNDHTGAGDYSIGVATRSSPTDIWNTIWSISPTSDINACTKTLTLSGGDVGASEFQIAFVFFGNIDSIYDWYIDDVKIYHLSNLDLKVSEVAVPNIVAPGNNTISAKVINQGVTNINTFDISYNVDGNPPVTETVTGVDIASLDEYMYTFAHTWNAAQGNHSIEISISNINGGNDDYPSNNVSFKNTNVASATVPNFPLFEVFSSPTCAACINFDEDVLIPFYTIHENEIAVINYGVNWPAPGDPYYNTDDEIRKNYYEVNYVPYYLMSSRHIPVANNYFSMNQNIESKYNEAVAEQTFFEIYPDLLIMGNRLFVNIDIMPYVDAHLTVQVAIVEKITTGNVLYTNATESHYEMMKMLPDAYGTGVDFSDGNIETLSFSRDMTNSFVEEMEDLLLVVFIQDDTTQKVYQSAMVQPVTADISNELPENVKVYPNPSKGIFMIDGAEDMQIAVYNSLGMKILDKTSENIVEKLDLSGYPNGIYMLKLSQNDKSATMKIVIAK